MHLMLCKLYSYHIMIRSKFLYYNFMCKLKKLLVLPLGAYAPQTPLGGLRPQTPWLDEGIIYAPVQVC